MDSSIFDFNVLLISGIASGTSFLIFSWVMFRKKQTKISVCDKNTTICHCTEGYCGACGIKICKNNKIMIMPSPPKTLSYKIKSFLQKQMLFPKSSEFFNKQISFVHFILNPIIDRVRRTFKINTKSKTEKIVSKVAKILWDQGKYTEAAKINVELLNVKK
jgi:hypothetical protein